MECKSCKAKKVLVEGLGEGRSKITCQECGYSEIKDSKGRQMLTDDDHSQRQNRSKLLTETSP